VWCEAIQPYSKSDAIFTCPDAGDNPFNGYAMNDASSNDDFPGSPTPPGNWNDGRGGVPYINPAQSSVAQAAVVSPANCLWIYESCPNVLQQTDILTWADLKAYCDTTSTKTDCTGDGGNLNLDGSEEIAQILLNGGAAGIDAYTPLKNPIRHSLGTNIGWCDGHAKWSRLSTLDNKSWSIENVPPIVESPAP